jgi:endonuclease/exonuclease/phosphatase family metal-dependent hydrolase
MRSRLLTTFAVLVAAIGLLVVPLTAASAAEKPGKPLTVMTRNLYLGADINRPVAAALAAQPDGPLAVLLALGHATDVTRDIVDDTDFGTRAPLLADEVARTQPDLIGLQEVALWRSGPLQLGAVGVPNATTVDYDFLQMLLDALAARGLDYEAVQIGNRADVEAPAFTGSPFDGSIAQARDVRLTMRDVILMRADNGLRKTGEGDVIYDHNLAVSIGDVVMHFDRGYNWVDVRSGTTSLRFVNTHLEAFSSDLAFAQASQLLANAPATDRPTVFVCDCNSDPLNDSIKAGIDTLPHKAPYDLITGAGGFTDEWLQWAPAEEGWTSGLSETVDDATAAGFDHRIDMIFGKAAGGGGFAVDRGEVTGTDVGDRVPDTGLWPSDHGGVVLRLRGF